jgi:hypothetical protein
MADNKKKLVVERAFEKVEEFIWDVGSQRRFKMDKEDIIYLEEGNTLFRGDTAFSLEEEELVS